MDTASLNKVRADKWLWAARFYKTRSLATQAIERGKARLDGEVIKPAKELRVGDMLTVEQGDYKLVLEIKALSEVRRGAPEAKALYEETAESIQNRERIATQRKLAPEPTQHLQGRPSKRQRRDLDGFRSTIS